MIGVGDILESIRKILCDHYERTKDARWRDDAEHAKADYENELLRLQVLQERVKFLKMMVPEEEFEGIVRALIAQPLAELVRLQDAGVVGSAELGAE